VTADYVRGARHTGVEADHAIVVHSGITSPPSILDTFCAHHANRGVDVWELDARLSPERWVEGVADMGTHIAQSARLPVFIVGSSRNAAVICRALQTSDGLFGAVLIGNASPPLLSEQLAQSLGPNTKPVLCVIGDAGATSGLTAAQPALARSRCKRTPTTSIG
jgi:alpha-beta hydrolase superfamily lysophospholipase